MSPPVRYFDDFATELLSDDRLANQDPEICKRVLGLAVVMWEDWDPDDCNSNRHARMMERKFERNLRHAYFERYRDFHEFEEVVRGRAASFWVWLALKFIIPIIIELFIDNWWSAYPAVRSQLIKEYRGQVAA